jgi:hypothetical protein
LNCIMDMHAVQRLSCNPELHYCCPAHLLVYVVIGVYQVHAEQGLK